jgi:hypothetical protein
MMEENFLGCCGFWFLVSGNGNGKIFWVDESVNYLTEFDRRVTLDTFVNVKGYYRGKKWSRGQICECVNVRGESCI